MNQMLDRSGKESHTEKKNTPIKSLLAPPESVSLRPGEKSEPGIGEFLRNDRLPIIEENPEKERKGRQLGLKLGG